MDVMQPGRVPLPKGPALFPAAHDLPILHNDDPVEIFPVPLLVQSAFGHNNYICSIPFTL